MDQNKRILREIVSEVLKLRESAKNDPISLSGKNREIFAKILFMAEKYEFDRKMLKEHILDQLRTGPKTAKQLSLALYGDMGDISQKRMRANLANMQKAELIECSRLVPSAWIQKGRR